MNIDKEFRQNLLLEIQNNPKDLLMIRECLL